MNLETWHVVLGLKLYKVYINDDPGLTLTYFTCFYTYSRPRYQVSVYRTIGPLVFVLTVGPDIRRAFTGPLVLWFVFHMLH